MQLTKEWVVNNIVEEKYLELLKKLYPNQILEKLLLLNIDLRMLYLKHILMIENYLKNVVLNQPFIAELQNINNAYFLNNQDWKHLKYGQRLVRSGYTKYIRGGVLKSKTIHSLIEAMSFEWIMKLLETLTDKNLAKIAATFGVSEFKNYQIFIEQLTYIKDIRNYLSHNFKVLGIHFAPKRTTYHYQQELEANNGHHYLHLLINNFSKKSDILPLFLDEYRQLFKNYDITINSNLMEKIDEQTKFKTN